MKNSMKKLTAVSLAAVMTVGLLSACGKKEGGSKEK